MGLSLLLFLSLTSPSHSADSLDTLYKKYLALIEVREKCISYCEYEKRDVENFFDEKLAPAMLKSSAALVKKPNVKISNLIIDIALLSKGSASEEISYAVADIYIANPDEFFKTIKKRSESEQIELNDHADWGVQNHTDLPKSKMQSLLQKLKDNHPKKKAKAEK